MKTILYSLLAAAACGMALGQTAYTNPVGYVSQQCKGNSDTIVAIPLRKSSAFAGTLSAAPDTITTPGSAILSLSGTPNLVVNAFAGSYYAKFKKSSPAAAGDGQWFSITANAAASLTVNLNGAAISAVSGAALEVIKYWTLNELIDPALSTTDYTTTGNVMMASTSELSGGRRTQLLIPNLIGNGVNLSPTTTYYVNAGIWKKNAAGSTNFGIDQLWPDTYFIIRHPSQVLTHTTFTATGEVEPTDINVGLRTQALVSQDNYVGIPRPVDTTLNALNLGGTAAFLTSTSELSGGRRDQLLVYNNAAVGKNKAPSVTYYYNAGIWKKNAAGSTDFGSDVIPAGAGFVIRKYKSGDGADDIWNNIPVY